MSWYFCSGCGPSVKCDVCGATECAQEVHSNARNKSCPGCIKASEQSKGPIPWNMQIIPNGARGWKHLRKRDTRIRIHRHKQRKFMATTKKWIRSQGRWTLNHYWAGFI